MDGPDRRGLLKVLGAAAASIPALRSAHASTPKNAYPRQHVGRASELLEMVPQTFTYPDPSAHNIIVRLSKACPSGAGPDQTIVAYSTICPHMGCPIEPRVEATAVLAPCRCHFSCFDLSDNGALVQGPATQPLPRILLEIDGDDIYAVGIDGLIFSRHHNLQEPY